MKLWRRVRSSRPARFGMGVTVGAKDGHGSFSRDELPQPTKADATGCLRVFWKEGQDND